MARYGVLLLVIVKAIPARVRGDPAQRGMPEERPVGREDHPAAGPHGEAHPGVDAGRFVQALPRGAPGEVYPEEPDGLKAFQDRQGDLVGEGAGEEVEAEPNDGLERKLDRIFNFSSAFTEIKNIAGSRALSEPLKFPVALNR